MSQYFTISATNPNDDIGGGGCLCSETKHDDQVGPYYIFPATSTDSAISPHTVLCDGCACATLETELEEDEAIDIPDEDVVEIPDGIIEV